MGAHGKVSHLLQPGAPACLPAPSPLPSLLNSSSMTICSWSLRETFPLFHPGGFPHLAHFSPSNLPKQMPFSHQKNSGRDKERGSKNFAILLDQHILSNLMYTQCYLLPASPLKCFHCLFTCIITSSCCYPVSKVTLFLWAG